MKHLSSHASVLIGSLRVLRGLPHTGGPSSLEAHRCHGISQPAPSGSTCQGFCACRVPLLRHQTGEAMRQDEAGPRTVREIPIGKTHLAHWAVVGAVPQLQQRVGLSPDPRRRSAATWRSIQTMTDTSASPAASAQSASQPSLLSGRRLSSTQIEQHLVAICETSRIEVTQW